MKLLEFFSAQNLKSLFATAKDDPHTRYEAFRALLNHNRNALHHMAELEQDYYSDHPINARTVRESYARLIEHVMGLADALNALSGDKFKDLPDVCRSIDADIIALLTAPRESEGLDAVMPLEQLDAGMLASAGGKAVNLAVLKNELKLPVPEGFVVTAGATARFLLADGLRERIHEELAGQSPHDMAGLEASSATIEQWILAAPVPELLAAQITAAYAELETKTRPGVRIAVRSSAVGEDGDASFAGQYSTELNVTRNSLIDAFKRVVASKYSPRAISYRQLLGLNDEDTPMCVIGLAMVDAKASGVMYTLDPESLDVNHVKVSSLWGLGEQLVGGDATPDAFLLDKQTGAVVERNIALKAATLVSLADGGIRLEDTREDRRAAPSLTDDVLRQLCAGAVRIEDHYRDTQDIEWAINAEDCLFFLQTRPLHIAPPAEEQSAPDFAGLCNFLPDGVAASRGIATGRVFIARSEKDVAAIPDHAILVTRTASPAYAAAIGRINALIADVGSVTSHLSSVAREFGVPAIVNAGTATQDLTLGEEVTVVAESRVGVFPGIVAALVVRIRPAKKRYVGSPVHLKLRAVLDRIAPLNLTDAQAPTFSVAGCQTCHDVIRFCHEHAMRAMFDISASAEDAGKTRKVVTHLPLAVYVIDLGGGLHDERPGRKAITPESFASLPMQAIWNGLTHPGISWEGTINFASSRFMSLMASIATSELGPEPGGDSYVLLSRDYMNFSAKFGYHYATIDALCGDEPGHNYIAMQFAGGAGNYFGRSLRIQFLGTILERLGFEVSLQGDLIEAAFNRHDSATTQDRLDQLGRLLASCRLLDMTLSNEDTIVNLADAFMAGDYDFLKPRDAAQPNNFYTQHGHWTRRDHDGIPCLYQSGRMSGKPVLGGLSGLIGKTIGASYQELLDSIGAYFYFPLAIAKNSETGDGRITVGVLPEGGKIDRAGGIVFGLKNAANYFVFRINALEDNAILFEYVDGKRIERKSAKVPIKTGQWHRLGVIVSAQDIRCTLGAVTIIDYRADKAVTGHAGLWTKADSATWFGPLAIEAAEGKRIFEY